MAQDYDWAAATLDLFRSEAENIRALVEAANLDGKNGDLAGIDFSDIDLSNQDLSGWDLSFASLRNAKVSNANFYGSLVDPQALIEATDWRDANLDPELRAASEEAELFLVPLSELRLDQKTRNLLYRSDYKNIGDILKVNDISLFRIEQFGRSRLSELRSALIQLSLTRARRRIDAYRIEYVEYPRTESQSGSTFEQSHMNSPEIVVQNQLSIENCFEKTLSFGHVQIKLLLPHDVDNKEIINALHPPILKFARIRIEAYTEATRQNRSV